MSRSTPLIRENMMTKHLIGACVLALAFISTSQIHAQCCGTEIKSVEDCQSYCAERYPLPRQAGCKALCDQKCQDSGGACTTHSCSKNLSGSYNVCWNCGGGLLESTCCNQCYIVYNESGIANVNCDGLCVGPDPVEINCCPRKRLFPKCRLRLVRRCCR